MSVWGVIVIVHIKYIEKKVHDIIYVRVLNYVDVFYNRESLLGLKQTIFT